MSTIFGEMKEMSRKEINQIFSILPHVAKESLIKALEGKAEPISSEEVEDLRLKYLNTPSSTINSSQNEHSEHIMQADFSDFEHQTKFIKGQQA